MDPRNSFIQQLEAYHPTDKIEQASRNSILAFVQKYPHCFENDCLPGHITGSALVVDETLTYTLLTHHRKLGLWVQFGGHSDGQPDPIRTGVREAEEESGLKTLRFIRGREGIFDVDVHDIPARGDMPSHKHYDIRIVLMADRNEPFTISEESHDLLWVKLEETKDYNPQPSFLRMITKIYALREDKTTTIS